MELHQELIKDKDSSLIRSNSYLISESAYNTCIFKNEKNTELEICIRKINSKINDGNNKQSLHLLLLLMPQCSVEILKAEGERWFYMCYLHLIDSRNTLHKPSLCLVLSFLVQASESISYLKERIGKKLRDSQISSSVKKLVAMDDNIECKLTLLYDCLRVYPGSLQSHTKFLEGKIINFLSRPHEPYMEKEVYTAGQVYSALKDSKISKLVSLGHTALDIIFESIVETEEYSSLIDANHITCIETLKNIVEMDEPKRKIFVALAVICNVLIFVKAFLQNCPDRSVNICPGDLISLPLRIIQVDLRAVRKLKGQEHSHLASLLPSLHQRALSHITELLRTVGDSLDLFHGVLLDNVTSILKTSRRPKISNTKNMKLQSDDTRMCCYEVLHSLVDVCKGCYPMSFDVCEALIADIIPRKEGLILREVRGQSLSNISIKKRSKKKGYTATTSENSIIESQHISFTSNEKVVVSALNLVTKWVELGSHTLPLNCLEKLSNSLLSLGPRPTIGVYGIGDVRLCYYEALVSLAMYPNPAVPPHYEKIHAAFTAGVSDLDCKVSAVCSRGLGVVSFIFTNPEIAIFNDYVTQRDKERKSDEKEEEVEEESDMEKEEEDENEEKDSEEEMNGAMSEEDHDENEISEDEEPDEKEKKTEAGNEEKDFEEEIANEMNGSMSEEDQEDEEDSEISEEEEPEKKENSKLNVKAEEGREEGKSGNGGQNSDEIEVVILDGDSTDCVEAQNGGTTSSDDILEIPVNAEGESGQLENAAAKKRKKKSLTKKIKKKKIQEKKDADEDDDADVNAMMASFVDADPDDSGSDE